MKRLAFLVLLLVSCSPAPTPEPVPLPTRSLLVEGSYYFPYFPTSPNRPKLGLAAGGIQEWPETPKLLELDFGAPSHQWGPFAQGPEDFYGLLRHPFIWGITPEELAQATRTLEGYDGVILPFNECDRPDQCGRKICIFLPGPNIWDCSAVPQVTAAAMIAAMDGLPDALWITPSFSDADKTCNILAAWWLEFLALGGDESRIVGMGYHRYSVGTDSFSAVLDECYATLETAGVPTLPVWATEVGLWYACNEVGAERFKDWLEKAMADPRVINVMIYAPRASFPFCPLMDETGLTDYGKAVRDAGNDVTVPAYP